ncbi:MAG: ABC transporter ATP-binding protein [Phycisphaeraceae bacterium]|nr:ABC transporter ATP-binding protein [Phycisphaerae bacterium]MBX3392482.1 ABC transporter ATP-binding protein [Phycisphaeraceae bacterium]HRJ50605.1 ABC transporter ATP-binding protein [Phycisphaerales bacterium]
MDKHRAAENALDIRDLRFRYPVDSGGPSGGSAGWSISIASLAVRPGEQVLLTAGSGRGKSTLLHLIAGLMDPSSGTVRIAGQDIHALRGAARDRFRGRHVGMIFQTFNLLHGFSAIENVMAALMFSEVPPGEHAGRAADLLGRLGIERAGADPDRLSVGQQQRVAVARALACDPVLVLADEPTASLDPQNAAAAITLIQEACREKGAALVCVSHDPAMAERFERRESLDSLASA